MSRKTPIALVVSRRAARDVQEIFNRSIEQWGARTANKYLDDLEAAMARIQSHPDLLTPLPDLDASFRYYRVNRHLMVCDSTSKSIIVLTVMHSSMDLAVRLAELQPTLAIEVEVLRNQLP